MGNDWYLYARSEVYSIVTTISFGSANAIAGTYRIYRKATWGDTWTLDETLVLESVSWTANPTIPAASFSYHYGPAIERTAATQTLRAKKDLAGAWIRIEVDCPDGIRHWCGYVDSQADLENGFVTSGATTVATGRQSFQCVGVIQALAYARLEKSFINRKPTAGADEIKECLSAPRFNEVIGNEPRPRKTRENSKASGENSYVHIFNNIYGRATRTEYKTWSTKDICEHLLDRYYVANSAGDREIEFEWKTGALDKLPTDDTPFLDGDGLTVLDALNQLLNASTLYGYTADLNNTSGKVEIDVFTFTPTDVALGDFTVPENTAKYDLAMIGDPGTTYSIQTNLSDFYHQIVARGDYRKTICTIETPNNQVYLKAADTELQSRLDSRVAAVAADTNLSWNEKSVRIQAIYDAPEFKDFNVAYAPHPGWNYQISGEKVFEDQDGETYWPNPQNIRILEELPLPAAKDYSASITLDAIGSASTQLLPNQVFSKRLTGTDSGEATLTYHATEWMYWGHRSKQSYFDSVTAPPFTLEAEPIPGLGMGIRYRIEGASSYHLKQTSSIPYPEWSPHMPSIDPRVLRVTVCVQEDRRLEKVHPTTLPTGKDAIRKLYIVNERYKKVRVLKDTLLFTNNAVHQVASTTSAIDESSKLDGLAKRLATWFTVPRSVLRINSVRTSANLKIGALIEKIEPTTDVERTINSVITSLAVSFSDRPHMEIQTQTGELDPLAFLPQERRL